MPRSVVFLFTIVAVITAGCGSSSKSGRSATTAAASTTTAAPATTTIPGGTAYASKQFVVPFTMALDRKLASPPKTETSNFVTWQARASKDNAVRVMVPVELYKPRNTTPQAPPQDYATYLQGLTNYGVGITETKHVAIDGHDATLMDVTSTSDLDGAIGCAEKGADQSDGCFGPQTDVLLRLAVTTVGDKTLLIWARTPSANPDSQFLDAFQQMLGSVRFRSAPPSPS